MIIGKPGFWLQYWTCLNERVFVSMNSEDQVSRTSL